MPASAKAATDPSNPKLEALLQQLETTITQQQALIKAIRAASAGENPTQALIVRWCDAWKRRYRIDYVISKADAGNMKRLVGVHGAEDLAARLERFLKDADPWLVRQKHPLAVFWARANSYGAASWEKTGGPERDEPAAATGCSHAPACRSDAEHTKRKLDEVYQ